MKKILLALMILVAMATESMATEIIVVSAQWCAPCRYFKKSGGVEQWNERNPDIKMTIYPSNSDYIINKEYHGYINRVRSIPTFLILDDNGKEVGRYIGFSSIEKLFRNLELKLMNLGL